MSKTIFGRDTRGMSIRELFREKNDRACYEEIFARYLPDVEKRVREYSCGEDEYQELYSGLCEVLVRCVNQWEESPEQVLSYHHFGTALRVRLNGYIEWNWSHHKDRKMEVEQVLYSCSKKGLEVAHVEENIDLVRYVDYSEAVRVAIEGLNSEREREVIIARYFGQMTLEEVGEMYGFGRERIRQIEARALRKIRGNFGRREMRRVDYC